MSTTPSTATRQILVEVLAAKQHKLALLTLNVEKTLNSLNLDMVRTIATQLRQWENDDEIALVVLQGAGDKAFCAGGDVQQLYQSAIDQPGGPCEYAEAFFLEEYQLNYQIHRYPKPILCLGSGIVMGGGLGLMAGASHRVASETTRIAMPEISIGLFPDVGGTWFLNRMPGGLGVFFALTGASLNAHDALYSNLVDVVLPSGVHQQLLLELQEQVWAVDQDSNSALLDDILAVHAIPTAKLETDIPSEVKSHLGFLEAACQQTSLGEVVSYLYRQSLDSKWMDKAIDTLKHGSPLSSLLIFEQLKRYRYASLEQVFQSELVLATNCIRYPEFAEGVRALLIDKDRSPKWAQTHFSQVPASLLENFFTAPWPTNPLNNLGIK